MRLFDRYKPEMNKSMMREAFDNHKKYLRWMKGEDDLWGFDAEYTMVDELVNDICKKEKKEMTKAMIPNIRETERISVNYEGATYYVDQGEIEYRTFENYPTVTVKFIPSPGRRIMAAVPKDSRCVKCPPNDFNIDKVTFNGPKTIVEWKDGTKTIVNCNDEIYDPEKGLAMAIVKKAFGNKGNYYNTFRKAMENARYYNQPGHSEVNRLGDALLAGFLAGLGLDKKMDKGENKCE